MKKILSLFPALFLVISFFSCERNEVSLTSPSGNLLVEFEITADGLCYSIEYKGEDLIDDAPLGLEFNDMDPFVGLGFAETSVLEIDETWERVWGKSKTVRNHCNALTVSLQEGDGHKRKLNLVFRAYDDGVAFRYHVPKQENIDEF